LITDGTQLQDAVSGATYTVAAGNLSITLSPLTGALLLPSPVKVDLIPPVTSIATNPAANLKGWIDHSPVAVNLSATDSGSGVEQLRYWLDNGQVTVAPGNTASANVPAEGSYTVGLRALDHAGNISSLATLKFGVDITPPVVTVTGVSQGAIYLRGSVPAAGCTTTDALSGVATNATVNITGGNRDGEGQFTATCSGDADNAGNITPPIAVTYDVVRDVSRSVRLHTEFRSTKYRNGRMTVRNISKEKYLRPAASVLTDLPPGVTLANATGTYLGNPYITIPGVTTLKPGDAASVEVEFNNPSNVKVGFTSVTYAGQFD
jgi:hypothetical protein